MFLEKIFGYRIEKIRFLKQQGYPLNLKRPRTFSEKIVWKKLFDRNPLLTLTADKYKVRTYLERELGKEEAEKIFVPLLYVTNNPEKIPFDRLPESYIIKANHGCGWNIIVNGGEVDRNEIILTCKKWLSQCYGLFKNEWAYKKIERKILIEELLKDEHGKIPKDYKLFVFHGVCREIMIISDRDSVQSKNIISYDRNWNCISQSNSAQHSLNIEKPETSQKMIELAEKLGRAFDFVRVDLYTINGNVYFGELTHYPMSGLYLKRPLERNIKTGEYWNLEINMNWKEMQGE